MRLGARLRCLFRKRSKEISGAPEREGDAIAGRRKRHGIWQVKKEQFSGFFRKFRFIAEATENGDAFRLECSWVDFTYILDVKKNDEIIFVYGFFSDTKDGRMEDIAMQIIRIAYRDIENKLVRMEQIGARLYNKR